MDTSCLPESPRPMGARFLDSLLALSPEELCRTDIAEMNLLCATGLPGAANLSVGRCLATLDGRGRAG